jgi:PKD repeat protein
MNFTVIYRHLRLLMLTLALASFLETSHGEIIPQDRRVDWIPGVNVGVPGGIPNRTTVYTTFAPGATAAQINSAIAACPSNQVIKLGAGTFTLGSTLNFGFKKGVTLRGAGASTILKPSHNDTIISVGGDVSENAGTDITAGYAKGSTNLTVASTAGLSVGMMVRIDQMMDPSIMWSSDGTTQRLVNQESRIDAISGSVVTIWPPLYYGLTPNGAPKMHNYGSINNQASFCGIEDLTIDATGHSTVWGVVLETTYACWMKNVRSIKVNNYHVYNYRTLFNEFAKVFIDDSPDYLPNHGGILVGATATGEPATATFIYDCIFNKILPGVEMNGGSAGCVIAYNYFRDPRYSDTAQAMGLCMNHSAQNMMNLYEGNVVNMIMSDGYFGGSSHNTVFRNWATGWTETFGSLNSRPIALCKWSLYENIVGNVVGITNFTPDYYMATAEGFGYETSTAFYFGYPNGGNADYIGTRPPSTDRVNAYDRNVTNTMILHGNWDSKTKSQIWSPSISDRNLPNSLYLSSKPAWFGNLVWPPFDPAKGYSNLDFSSIPAGYRFIHGIDPPSGPQNLAPIVAATGSPTSGNAPLIVNFSSAGTSDPEGSSLTYSWVFGDGTTGTTANPAHTYSSEGTFNAVLTVSDGVNATASSPIQIRVGNQPPIAAASVNVTSGPAPLSVNFSSSGSRDPEGSTLTYQWSFGDGTAISTAPNPAHVYASNGIYLARLTVSDGQKTASSADIRITVNDGLVASYAFSSITGGVVTDDSGNGNSGTVSGAVFTANGRNGGALMFDGNSSVVTVNASASLDLTDALTLEAWVSPLSLDDTYQSVLSKPLDPSFSGISYALHGGSRPNTYPSLGLSSSPSNLYGNSALPLNAWTHLAATYDGTTMRLFINGTQVASQAQTGILATSTEALRIGLNWHGLIDEVRIYNRALTASQIEADMSASGVTRPTAPSGLQILP